MLLSIMQSGSNLTTLREKVLFLSSGLPLNMEAALFRKFGASR